MSSDFEATPGARTWVTPVRVGDLKQWSYCPRVVFHQQVYGLTPPPTEPMRAGREVEAVLEQLEKRRVLRRYGLDGAERVFDVPIVSERLGLQGRVDLLLRSATVAAPVDFKRTKGGVRRNHRVQLAAYAVLIEECLGLAVTRGFVHIVPTRETVSVPLGATERAIVPDLVTEVRRMIETQRFPEPADTRAKCVGCEYLNFCGDRF